MTIEKTMQGAWRIAAIVGDILVQRQYFFMTKREAVRAFNAETGRDGLLERLT